MEAGSPIVPASERVAIPSLPSAEIARYRQDGYAIARGIFSAPHIAELRQACDDLLGLAADRSADFFEGVSFFNIMRRADPFAKDVQNAPAIPGMLRRVTYPYACSATFNRYRAHPQLLSVVATLIGEDLLQIVNQVNFNPPAVGMGWGWHQDYRFRRPGIERLVDDFVQTIVALDPCNTHTGGIRLIPGSANLGELALDKDIEHAESHFDASLAVTPELNPGDVILFNSHVIHGSTANLSQQPRRVYINGYARASHATHGMPVLRGGIPSSLIEGFMEFEGDHERLPLAAKY